MTPLEKKAKELAPNGMYIELAASLSACIMANKVLSPVVPLYDGIEELVTKLLEENKKYLGYWHGYHALYKSQDCPLCCA